MAKRDSFLLRIDPSILEAIRRWSEDEMRSVNAQIEYILRSKLKDVGRLSEWKAVATEEKVELSESVSSEGAADASNAPKRNE